MWWDLLAIVPGTLVVSGSMVRTFDSSRSFWKRSVLAVAGEMLDTVHFITSSVL